MITWIHAYESPLGAMTMSSDGISLTGLWFDGQKYDRRGLEKSELRTAELPVFRKTAEWLDRYFLGKDPGPVPPLDPAGSDFRRLVAEIMMTILPGETMTYGQIAEEAARRLGRESMSAQAVGGAVGHNPISILIPCHRVVGSDGSLTGYAGGLDRKRWLLRHEAEKLHLGSATPL